MMFNNYAHQNPSTELLDPRITRELCGTVDKALSLRLWYEAHKKYCSWVLDRYTCKLVTYAAWNVVFQVNPVRINGRKSRKLDLQPFYWPSGLSVCQLLGSIDSNKFYTFSKAKNLGTNMLDFQTLLIPLNCTESELAIWTL